MAPAKKTAKANGKKTGALPKGFAPARTRLDGFFEREEGNSVQGILRGSFEVTGRFGVKRVFRIELTEGETQIADGEMVGKGAVVGLDETGYTKVLSELEEGSIVFVRYDGLGEATTGRQAPHVFTVGKAEA